MSSSSSDTTASLKERSQVDHLTEAGSHQQQKLKNGPAGDKEVDLLAELVVTDEGGGRHLRLVLGKLEAVAELGEVQQRGGRRSQGPGPPLWRRF